jgi:outer membrane protein assembly factor BamE
MKSLWQVPMLCLSVFSVAALNGCEGYRTDMSQGQDLTTSQVQSIHVGMSRQDVQDVLGEPVLENPYDPSHMIYVYTLLPVHGHAYKKELVLTMKQGHVAQVASNGYAQSPIPVPA